MASRRAIDELIAHYGTETVLQVLRPYVSDSRAARFETVLDRRLCSVSAVLEDLYDAHNGAAAMRSIEAFGLTDLHVIETGHRFRFSAGISMGCEKWISVNKHPDVETCFQTLRSAGFSIYTTQPDAENDVETVAVDRPIAVVFGNERDGVTDAAVAASDGAVSIRMHGFTESFNLSVSVAMVMHRLAARRRAQLGAESDLEAPERAFLRARWYALSVRAAAELMERHVAD